MLTYILSYSYAILIMCSHQALHDISARLNIVYFMYATWGPSAKIFKVYHAAANNLTSPRNFSKFRHCLRVVIASRKNNFEIPDELSV